MKRFSPPSGKISLPRFLFKYKRQLIISSIGGIVYNTVIVMSPILLGRMIDAAGRDSGRLVLLSALFFIGITAFFQLARLIKRWFMRDQFNRVACDLRQTFIERTLSRQAPDLDKETVGDLMSRTVGDITLVVDTVMTTLNEGWDTWLLMLSFFAAMLIQDWQITLIASIMVPVTIILAQLMRHVLYKVAMSARKATAESNSHLQRYLSAVMVLRLFGREKDEAAQIHAAFRRQAHFNIREMLIQQALLPVYALVAGTGIIAVLAFGGQNVINGVWSVGSFNAFLIMFIAFSGRTRVAARVFNRWHAARAAWSRVREKIDRQDLAQNGLTCGPVRVVNRLEIKDLSFGLGPEVFVKNINLTASRGQIIGVTGPVGSGKSMLATALTGLYPYSGSFLIDGAEWTDLDATERYGLVAYAGHEQYLFSMSVADNITITACSPDEIDSRRLEKAAETAALMQDLDRFPQGLSTLVGDKGTKVSGGQRQRIALARAIYAQAPILILDDPFSAVDIATESRIVQGLRQDCQDRIILLFSHRLTAFRHVDHVLVLNQGKIVQSGTHAQLYQDKGMYREICQAQFFLEGEGYESR